MNDPRDEALGIGEARQPARDAVPPRKTQPCRICGADAQVQLCIEVEPFDVWFCLAHAPFGNRV